MSEVAVRQTARVLGTEPLGGCVVVRLELPRAAAPAPGRFHMALDPDGAAFLPRPVGVLPLPDGGVGIVVAAGSGAGLLARAERLDLLGPLGRGFDRAAAAGARTLLVGEGFGVAAFAAAPALLGARPRLIAAGGAGLAPLVDAELEALAPEEVGARVAALAASGGAAAVWVAAGHAVGAAASAAALDAGIPCAVTLHAAMACGFGACYGCAVEVDGVFKRACVEGPVVDAARLGGAA